MSHRFSPVFLLTKVWGLDDVTTHDPRFETPSNGLRRARTANVHGTAHTKGDITLELVPNAALAELQLVYRGNITSHCQADVGPVNFGMITTGPVRAVTTLHILGSDVTLLPTDVQPDVFTRVTNVCAESNFVRRIGKRRAAEPEAVQQMNSRATYMAGSLLKSEMDQRVADALAEIQAELESAHDSLDSMQEVTAPAVREGANPHWHSILSTDSAILIHAESRRREQLGPVNPCPTTGIDADVETRIHVSFFNNMFETIMAGKTFTDEYFMRYGRILQAELPPELMVHSRSQRWAIIARKPRPLAWTAKRTSSAPRMPRSARRQRAPRPRSDRVRMIR